MTEPAQSSPNQVAPAITEARPAERLPASHATDPAAISAMPVVTSASVSKGESWVRLVISDDPNLGAVIDATAMPRPMTGTLAAWRPGATRAQGVRSIGALCRCRASADSVPATSEARIEMGLARARAGWKRVASTMLASG